VERQPINIPAAWRGPALFERDDWLHTLSDPEISELQTAFRRIQTQNIPLADVSPANFRLPTLSPRLLAIQKSLENGSGAAMIRGFPIERYQEEETTQLFWGLTSHLGTAVPQTAVGVRVFPVRDEGYAASHPQARGPSSRKRLSYHSDRCDVIAFLCVRQAKTGGENYLVSSVALYNEMLKRRPELVETLLQPYRYQRHNVDPGNELPYYEQPIFSFCEGHFAANVLRVLIERAYAAPGSPPMTARQREALDYLEELADNPDFHVVFRQEPGDIVLLNNWVTFHRRSEFVDHEDPDSKRLLLRIWLSVPNSRPLDPQFAGGYGATEAGAIRGGMRVVDPSATQ
jgi:hypothetical protein